MGDTRVISHQPQPQPQVQPDTQGATVPALSNADAAKQSAILRLLKEIPQAWKTLCGSLLSDVDPPPMPPKLDELKLGAYKHLAKLDGSGEVGFKQVATILGLFPSRASWYQGLLEVERAYAGDKKPREAIHVCLDNLAQGGEVASNTERIMAGYAMLSAWGRTWFKDAPWVASFALYLQNNARLYSHANYGESPLLGMIERTQARKQALEPLLHLLRHGALAGAPQADGKAAAAPAGPAPPTVEDKQAWAEQAAALKQELEPHLPADDGAPQKWGVVRNQHELLSKIRSAPPQVRDLVFADAVFMRRAAMHGNDVFAGALVTALDPIEALYRDCQGGGGAGAQITLPARFQKIRDHLLARPGDGEREHRTRVMTHTGLAPMIRIFSDVQQRELWRAATRGTLEPTVEDRLWAAVRGGNGAETARVLLGMGIEDRPRVRGLQDDLMFRAAIETEKMKAEVVVDGVKVRPHNMMLLMWGLRPGASHDPGAVGPVEDNPDVDQRPLTVDERRELDAQLYDPTIARLKKLMRGAEVRWAWLADAMVDDSDTVDCLEQFRQGCASAKYLPLIRRGGEPPGKVLNERFNAQTGKNIRDLLNRGLSGDYRRRAETALQITLDHAALGTVGTEITRAGDRPEGAKLSLDQAIGETRVADGRTVSQVVHATAKRLKSELHESEFWNGGADVSDCKEIWAKLNEQITPQIIEKLRAETGTKVYLIELLQNAYAQYDGPMIVAMRKGLQKHEQDIIFPLYGVDAASEEQRVRESAPKTTDPAGARASADTTFAAAAKQLFDALAGLSNSSEAGAFAAAKDKLAAYAALPAAPATTPDDYYRLHYGLTPTNHAVQVARAFRKAPSGYDMHNHLRGRYSPEAVAAMLGVAASAVTGAVATPSEEPEVDDRNRNLVRANFTRETAERNASEMWRILHEGGQLHLIQTMLYGAYNDEEQRLIRLAFRRLSGGIDWQFYVQQAKYMRARGQEGGHHRYMGRTDGRPMMVGAEGTELAAEDAKRNGYRNTGVAWVVADGGELDAALSVATHGELDLQAELRNALYHDSLKTVFRILERATPDQCRQILGDSKLLAELRAKAGGDAADWDRIYRILIGTDDLTVRLQSRVDDHWFLGKDVDEKGMKEDVAAYLRRLRVRIEGDVRAKYAANPAYAPDPDLIAFEVRQRLTEASRQLASNADVNAILQRELDGLDLSTARDTIIHGGGEGNTLQLVGRGDADKILDEIRRMDPAERATRFKDPDYMQQLGRRLTSAADMSAAINLLQSGTDQQAQRPGGDALADIEQHARKRDVDKMIQAILDMSADEHRQLLGDPRLLALCRSAAHAHRNRALLAQLLSIRTEDTSTQLGHAVVWPDANGNECAGRTLPPDEAERLSFLKQNAIIRLEHGASVSWNQALRQTIEVFKQDFKPARFAGDEPAPADKGLITKIEKTLREGIWSAVEKTMHAKFAAASCVVLRAGVMGEEDPSRSRIREQWGINDDEAGVEDTLRNCSNEILIEQWTSVKQPKPGDGSSLRDVYQAYRARHDLVGGARPQSSPEQAELHQAKRAFMNYVVDVSTVFEDDLLGNAGGLGDDSSRTTQRDVDRRRTRTRDNAEYLKWRTMLRDKIERIPPGMIAAAIGAGDRPADAALIDTPNRKMYRQREFREDEYLKRAGEVGAGSRVAGAERAAMTDAMSRYQREAAISETNEQGGLHVVTKDEQTNVEQIGQDADRAMREFSEARARIARWAALFVGIIVGAIVAIATGGAGAPLAYMLVAGAIAGAAGAAGQALTKEAIQGLEFDMSGEGAGMILEGAITGMVTAGATKMASGIMGRLAGAPAAKGVEQAVNASKPTTWQTILTGAKGVGYSAAEEALSEGLSGIVEAGLVVLDPGVWMHGWNEGVLRAKEQMGEKLSEIPGRMKTAAVTAALTHVIGSVVGGGPKQAKALSPADKLKTKSWFENYLAGAKERGKNYLDIKDIAAEAFATWIVDRLEGRPMDEGVLLSLAEAFLQELDEKKVDVVTGVYDLHSTRRKALQKQLDTQAQRLTTAEREHYIALNPYYGAGEILTVDEYLLAREGMFEARLAHWETAHGQKLTDAQAAAWQRRLRDARDSAEYQALLAQDPFLDPEVMAARGDVTGKDAAPTTDTAPIAPHPQQDPQHEPPPPPEALGTVDDMMKVTGEAEAIPSSNFTGQARTNPEEAKIKAEIARCLPFVVAMFGDQATQSEPHAITLKIGAHTFTVGFGTMPATTDAVARYRMIGSNRAMIEVSDRARDKHVERALAHEIAELIAKLEAMADGKTLPEQDALAPGSARTELSAHDVGRIAEIKVLLRQLHGAQHPPGGRKVNPQVVAQLQTDVDHLLAHLGLLGTNRDDRRAMLEAKLRPDELAALRRRTDSKQRLADSALPDHAGVEVHSHFLGVVDPALFAQRAAEREAQRQGKDVQELAKSSWELVLERIAGMKDIAHKDAAGQAVLTPGAPFQNRGTSGDAIALAALTLQVITTGATPGETAPPWLVQGARTLRAAQVELDALLADPTSAPSKIEAATAKVAAARAKLAEDASRVALTATEDTDFNSAYEIRDELIKDTFGDHERRQGAEPQIKELKAQLRAAREANNQELAKELVRKIAALEAEIGAYADFAKQTVRALIKDGLLYSEQSNSLKKLNERFSKELMDTVIWDVTAEMLATGEITESQALQLRQLTMVLTGFFGEEETRADELAADNEPARKAKADRQAAFSDKGWADAKKGVSEQLTTRSDAMGVDIAGPETVRFDELGQQRFKELYEVVAAAAAKRGRPLVLRPHVGEGFTDTEAGQPFKKNEGKTKDGAPLHYDRSRNNLTRLLDAIEEAQRGMTDAQKKSVIIRFGHATHTTPDQAARMAKLGIIAEVNLHSNVATNSIDQTDKETGKLSEKEKYDDHSLLTLIYYRVQTILSTDAHSVMQTDMAKEYERARVIVDEFLAGNALLRVAEAEAKGRGTKRTVGTPPNATTFHELRHDELTPAELALFLKSIEQLHKDATKYQADVQKGDRQDKLLFQELLALTRDPAAGKNAGKVAKRRDLIHRLLLQDGKIDEDAMAFARQSLGSDAEADLRAAVARMAPDAEGQNALVRWQQHGVDEWTHEQNKKIADGEQPDRGWEDGFNDPAFKQWFTTWLQQPNRIERKADGTWKANYPPGMPPAYRGLIDKITRSGNVSLSQQAIQTAATLAEAFPELAAMDPTSKEFQELRPELVRRFGAKAVTKFEQAVTGQRGDPHRAAMDAHVSLVISDEQMALIKSKFPGCEVFLTGSAAQPSKRLEQIKDLDVIVIAPAHMTEKERVALEKGAAGLKVKTTEQFMEQTPDKRAELEVDAKVMTPQQAFGWMKIPGRNTDQGFLRLDVGGDATTR